MEAGNAANEDKSDSSPVEEQPSSIAETASDALDAGNAAGANAEPTKRPKPASSDKSKIEILLKAAGNAPILKQKKWIVPQDRTIGWIMDFIKRCLKLEGGENLFLYLNQSFAPSPDQVIANLYECFGADGNLVFHYSLTPAWG
ncbi:autophagy protein 12-like [Cloeon dipterum]|uniref:autophagy protein 12-like n=1 Tax=Cloeon dipterum TaxID=197152 RepID=UPI00322074A8